MPAATNKENAAPRPPTIRAGLRVLAVAIVAVVAMRASFHPTVERLPGEWRFTVTCAGFLCCLSALYGTCRLLFKQAKFLHYQKTGHAPLLAADDKGVIGLDLGGVLFGVLGLCWFLLAASPGMAGKFSPVFATRPTLYRLWVEWVALSVYVALMPSYYWHIARRENPRAAPLFWTAGTRALVATGALSFFASVLTALSFH